MSNLIGNAPNQVPTNADLGDLAYQDGNYASLGNVTISSNATIANASITVASISGNTSVGGNLAVTGISTHTGNILVTTGNIILNPSQLNTSANSVQPKSYTDAMSIVFGF